MHGYATIFGAARTVPNSADSLGANATKQNQKTETKKTHIFPRYEMHSIKFIIYRFVEWTGA